MLGRHHQLCRVRIDPLVGVRLLVGLEDVQGVLRGVDRRVAGQQAVQLHLFLAVQHLVCRGVRHLDLQVVLALEGHRISRPELILSLGVLDPHLRLDRQVLGIQAQGVAEQRRELVPDGLAGVFVLDVTLVDDQVHAAEGLAAPGALFPLAPHGVIGQAHHALEEAHQHLHELREQLALDAHLRPMHLAALGDLDAPPRIDVPVDLAHAGPARKQEPRDDLDRAAVDHLVPEVVQGRAVVLDLLRDAGAQALLALGEQPDADDRLAAVPIHLAQGLPADLLPPGIDRVAGQHPLPAPLDVALHHPHLGGVLRIGDLLVQALSLVLVRVSGTLMHQFLVDVEVGAAILLAHGLQLFQLRVDHPQIGRLLPVVPVVRGVLVVEAHRGVLDAPDRALIVHKGVVNANHLQAELGGLGGV